MRLLVWSRQLKQQLAVVAANFLGRSKFPVDMCARGGDSDTCGKRSDSPANGAAEWAVNERCHALLHPLPQLADSLSGQAEFIAQFSERLTLVWTGDPAVEDIAFPVVKFF